MGGTCGMGAKLWVTNTTDTSYEINQQIQYISSSIIFQKTYHSMNLCHKDMKK
jgi:hypothetical protein